MCLYECNKAQLSKPPVLYIIGTTDDPSGCAQQTVDFHYRRTLTLNNSTRSTSVQGDHFHSVYFAAGMSLASVCFRTTVSQGSWDCTIVRPTEDLLLFPQMFSVGRVIAMVFDGTSSAQSQSQESPPFVLINDVVLRINE